MLSYRRLLACALRSFGILALLLLGSDCGVLTSDAAEVTKQDSYVKPGYLIDFSSYTGGSVDAWLNGHGYKLERDAKNSKLLGLSIIDRVFNIEAKARMSGFILNDHVNLENVKTIKLTWGVSNICKDVSYDRHVNNEALMLYIFFGKEKIPVATFWCPIPVLHRALSLPGRSGQLPVRGPLFSYRWPFCLPGQAPTRRDDHLLDIQSRRSVQELFQ